MRFILMMLLPTLLFAQVPMFDPPLSERIVDYKIDCRLDPATKIVSGAMDLSWRNATEDPATELQFHLFQNAFESAQSSMLLEAPDFPESLRGQWGFCRMIRLGSEGRVLLSHLKFIQPDDGNLHDRTVCAVSLPEPVMPGASIQLRIEFETKLPPVVSRSGYSGDFFSVTQWFPKLGVWEDGRWICHQYHSHGEFYADFGVYDVSIIVPEKYRIGATGICLETSNLGDGWKRVRHYCEDVHDFTWCVDTDFVEILDTFEDTQIRFLCQPDHAGMADRFIRAVKVCFEYYGSRYGAYPYPIVTMIDTEHRGTGEMEYPTFFLTGNFDADYEIGVYQAEPLPESERYTEWLTIHEFGHNWWMGMIGNNETDHVWVDEGINSYASTRALEYGYDPYILKDYREETRTARNHERDYYLARPRSATVLQTSWLFRPGDEFFTYTYCKPELMLHTLHNYFGDEVWGRVMKTFFQRWKFKHPKTLDFYDVVHEITGRNMIRFFDAYMTTTHTLDFVIESVEDERIVVRRDGALRFPVDIALYYTSGSQELLTWDNVENLWEYVAEDGKILSKVIIDPDQIIEFELSKDNNFWMKE